MRGGIRGAAAVRLWTLEQDNEDVEVLRLRTPKYKVSVSE